MTVTGRIDDVRKLGDRWRAELLVAGTRIIVVGQPGSGIAVGALVEGRMASVVGIVRRPYPTASDQRYAITPRTPADLRILGSHAPGTGRSTASAAHPVSSPGEPTGAAERSPAGTLDADLIDLAAFVGRTVRVGGLIVGLRPDGLLLDDGTGVSPVTLRGSALEILPLLEPEDAINATGRVEQTVDGATVVVEDPGGIIQAGDPVAPAAGGVDGGKAITHTAEATGSGGLQAAAPSTHLAGLLDGPTGIGGGLAGLGILIALSLASLAVSLGRRVHERRRLERKITARLSEFGASPGPPPAPRSTERDSSTFGPA